MNKKISMAILILLVVFLVGCNSSTDKVNEEIGAEDNGNTNSAAEESNAVEEDSNSATEPTNSAESKVIVGNNVAVGDNSASSLSQILGGKTLKYTATYDLTVENQKQVLTYVYDLPDFVMIVDVEDGESRMIFKDSIAYSCTDAQGEWMCFKLADVQTGDNDKLESNVEQGKAQTTYVGKCSRAGLAGEKYTVVSEGVTSSVCYTTNGVLLEMETEKSTMYATKVSQSIDSNMFKLPAEPQDFSKMFQGIDTE
jgi:hypothetical protein